MKEPPSSASFLAPLLNMSGMGAGTSRGMGDPQLGNGNGGSTVNNNKGDPMEVIASRGVNIHVGDGSGLNPNRV